MSAKPRQPRSPAPAKATRAKAAPRRQEPCPIVGIGTSAGGSEEAAP